MGDGIEDEDEDETNGDSRWLPALESTW